MNENVQLLASESVIRRFARYVSLSILSMLGVAVYYFTDTFFISDQIGPVGLASLNFAVPIYFAANAIGLLLGIGGATKYTIHKTRGDVFKGDQVYTNMMALSVVISVVFIMVGILFAPQIAELFGANHETLAPTTTYVMIVMIFTPCFMYSNIFVAFIRNDNSPMISTICMVTGTILNIILDYIFIYPLHLGMFGAALATGVSPMMGMVLGFLLYILPGKSSFHLRKGTLDPSVMADCCSLGVSSFIVEISTGIVVIISNITIVGIAGNMGVAAYSIIANTGCVLLAIFVGLIQGSQPLLSDYYAADMRRREKQTLRLALGVSFAFGLLIFLCGLLFAPEICSIFNSGHNEQLEALAVPGIRLYYIGFILCGVNMTLAQMMASVEKAGPSMIISIARGLIVISAAVILMGRLWGLAGVWLSFPVTELITFVIAAALYLDFERKRPDVREP